MNKIRILLSILLTVCLLAACIPAAGATGLSAPTGETVNPVPWIILLVISGICIVALVVVYLIMKNREE